MCLNRLAIKGARISRRCAACSRRNRSRSDSQWGPFGFAACHNKTVSDTGDGAAQGSRAKGPFLSPVEQPGFFPMEELQRATSEKRELDTVDKSEMSTARLCSGHW